VIPLAKSELPEVLGDMNRVGYRRIQGRRAELVL